jgi:hypothetical protein
VCSLLAAAVAIVGLVVLGFGELGHQRQGPGYLVLYAATFGWLATSIAKLRARRALRALLGFAPGVYAIGTQMIDARDRVLRIAPLFDATPEVIITVIRWHGFSFMFANETDARAALHAIGGELAAIRAAAAAGDAGALLARDPLGLGAWFGERPSPAIRRARLRRAIAAIAIVGCAYTAWFVRDQASDVLAYDAIFTARDAERWVKGGGDPERGQDMEMWLRMTEVAAHDWDSAETLRTTLARYVDAPPNLTLPLVAALRTRYANARNTARSLSRSPQLTRFIDDVYDRLDAGVAPEMTVRIARTDSVELAKLDAAIADAKLAGEVESVAKYFERDNDARRSTELMNAIEAGLQHFFPRDVMTIDHDNATRDAAQVEIFYVIRPRFRDGEPVLYSKIDDAGKPVRGARAYPGIELELGARLNVVAGSKVERVTFVARPSPKITVRDSSDAASIYRAMEDSAFAELGDKLVAALGGHLS